MPLDRLNEALEIDLKALRSEGRAKPPERVITGYLAPTGERGPRYLLDGVNREFIRMNSNGYLSMSHHPRLIRAAHKATDEFGVGPGAVRFIDGTYVHHVKLEERIARFVDKPAAKIFNSAYTTVCGMALSATNSRTYWIGDELNHNCIIRSMRIANVPSENKAIYSHNDMKALGRALENVPDGMERVVVVFDGIFSMRGDFAPVDRIVDLAGRHQDRFKDGVITIMDDSHGIGAYGDTGRGYRRVHGRVSGRDHRDLRQGLRSQRRLCSRQFHRDRGHPAKGRHVYLHESAQRGRLRGRMGGR